MNFPLGFLRVRVGLTRSCCCEQTPGPEVAPARRDLFGLLSPERWSIMAESCGSKRLEQKSPTTHKKQRERRARSGVRLRTLKAHPQWCTPSSKAPVPKGSTPSPSSTTHRNQVLKYQHFLIQTTAECDLIFWFLPTVFAFWAASTLSPFHVRACSGVCAHVW